MILDILVYLITLIGSLVVFCVSCLCKMIPNKIKHIVYDVLLYLFNMTHLDIVEKDHIKKMKLLDLFLELQLVNKDRSTSEILEDMENSCCAMKNEIYTHYIVLSSGYTEESKQRITRKMSDFVCKKIRTILYKHNPMDNIMDLEILILHCIFNRDERFSDKCFDRMYDIVHRPIKLFDEKYNRVSFTAKQYYDIMFPKKTEIYINKNKQYYF